MTRPGYRPMGPQLVREPHPWQYAPEVGVDPMVALCHSTQFDPAVCDIKNPAMKEEER